MRMVKARRGMANPGIVAMAEDVLASFEEFLITCREGAGRAILVNGPMGVGKTSTLRVLRERARTAGAVVVTVSAGPEVRHLRFGVTGEILRQVRPDVSLPDVIGPAVEFGCFLTKRDGLVEDDLRLAHSLSTKIVDLPGEQPLIIMVDDAHYTDPQSLQVLLFVARRLAAAKVMIVLAEAASIRGEYQRFRAEIGRLPWSSCVRLSRPTLPDLARLLSSRVRDGLGERSRWELARTCQELTGGNLLLVNAMIEDLNYDDMAKDVRSSRHGAEDEAKPFEAGSEFRDAVLSCVHRCDFPELKVIQSLAVLGRSAGPSRIGKLLDMDAAAVSTALSNLTLNGLLKADRFRAEAVAGTVLGGMTAGERAELHQKAARLLIEEDADAVEIAAHLIAPGVATERWHVEFFLEAGDDLERDRPDLTLRYLKAAWRLSEDEAQRARIMMRIAVIEWRINPHGAKRHLARMIEMPHFERLPQSDVLTVVRQLLWFGRITEVEEMLRQHLERADKNDPAAMAELNVFSSWLAYAQPAVSRRLKKTTDLPGGGATTAAPTAPYLQLGELIDVVLQRGSQPEVLAGIRNAIQRAGLGDSTHHLLVSALRILLSSDELSDVADRCDDLIREATGLGATAWRAELTDVRAAIALLQGDLRAAIAYGESALTELGEEGWGVEVGGPLSSLISAYTARGDYEKAAAIINKPVQPEAFHASTGLQYLRACGEYHMAIGDPRRAQADFHAYRELVLDWGLDIPNFVPWRTDLAKLHLSQGDEAEARRLVREHLDLSPRDRESRARGIGLRILAQVSVPSERTGLLIESATMLEGSEARLELAYTLCDLSLAHRLHGDTDAARMAERRAKFLARQCGGRLPHQGRSSSQSETRDSKAHRPAAGALSKAERRVATLAADGFTNEDIARKLFLTVSTVEQHLTHVYRKLNVQGRKELSVTSRKRILGGQAELLGVPPSMGHRVGSPEVLEKHVVEEARSPLAGPNKQFRGQPPQPRCDDLYARVRAKPSSMRNSISCAVRPV
jgi:DNA-binding CsgD family transcriptional regulator